MANITQLQLYNLDNVFFCSIRFFFRGLLTKLIFERVNIDGLRSEEGLSVAVALISYLIMVYL